MSNTEKYKVTNTPWPNELPNGSTIVKAERRADEKDNSGDWFTREDGKNMFPSEGKDNRFKLYYKEVQKL